MSEPQAMVMRKDVKIALLLIFVVVLLAFALLVFFGYERWDELPLPYGV